MATLAELWTLDDAVIAEKQGRQTMSSKMKKFYDSIKKYFGFE
jgi:hypothetical protein